MERLINRRPFQGVVNIIRFNRHFYILALILLIILVSIAKLSSTYFAQQFALIGAIIILISTMFSILTSWYIYDFTKIYTLSFIESSKEFLSITNFNAGFDEFSHVIKHKFPNSTLKVFDFYNPYKHTEISIKRARRAIKPYPGTITIDTASFIHSGHQYNIVFLIFSAHEIRDKDERARFFQTIGEILQPNGKLYLIEHVRDFPNFLAYNLGFLHFYSDKSWKACFKSAKLKINKQDKLNPFINLYEILKDDTKH